MTGGEIGSAVQLACLLEASASKPGNVTPGRRFRDMSYEDFLASAAAIGPAFTRAGERGLGATILEAIQATRRWTRGNTNLGIILLAAPLARAAAVGGPLHEGVRRELEASTVEDAVLAYEAIRLASPGGLGSAAEADVRDRPTVTLRHAMQLSAHRDSIAQEWASGFDITFGCGVPALRAALAAGKKPEQVKEDLAYALEQVPKIGEETKDLPAEGIALDSPQFAVLSARADAAAASGRIDEAAAAYEEILSKVKYDTPWAAPEKDLRSAQRLARLLRTLTSLYVQAGDETKAEAIRKRRQELARMWEARLPANPVVKGLRM